GPGSPFFYQAEDGIRAFHVTGVQTCALPILGLDVNYPNRVTSSGGRYRYQDDWETPDTQVINLEFDNNTSITWEGRSCNGHHVAGSSVGVIFYGEDGALQIDGGNSYKIFDLKNQLVKDVENDFTIDARNLSSPAQALDALH